VESARLADHHDVERVAELWDRAAAELGAQRGGAQLVRSVTPPASWSHAAGEALEHPDRVLAVGAIDHVVVGFGYGKVIPDQLVGEIEILYVEPEAREVGVGEAIVGVLMEHFDRAGCAGVDAFALPGNRQAKAYFETHGFVTRMLVMHRPAPSHPEE
jgi:ribosomal protein S18 acetylase RimI-like enzyme